MHRARQPWPVMSSHKGAAAACGVLGQPREEASGLVQVGGLQEVARPGEEEDTAKRKEGETMEHLYRDRGGECTEMGEMETYVRGRETCERGCK